MLQCGFVLLSQEDAAQTPCHPGTGQHLRSPRSTRVSGLLGGLTLTATGRPPATGQQTTAYQDTPATGHAPLAARSFARQHQGMLQLSGFSKTVSAAVACRNRTISPDNPAKYANPSRL